MACSPVPAAQRALPRLNDVPGLKGASLRAGGGGSRGSAMQHDGTMAHPQARSRGPQATRSNLRCRTCSVSTTSNRLMLCAQEGSPDGRFLVAWRAKRRERRLGGDSQRLAPGAGSSYGGAATHGAASCVIMTAPAARPRVAARCIAVSLMLCSAAACTAADDRGYAWRAFRGGRLYIPVARIISEPRFKVQACLAPGSCRAAVPARPRRRRGSAGSARPLIPWPNAPRHAARQPATLLQRSLVAAERLA